MSTSQTSQATLTPGDKLVVRQRVKWGQFVSAAVLLLFLFAAAVSVIQNENFQWPMVAHYLFEPTIMRGVWTTIVLTLSAEIIGLVLGTILATMALSDNKVLSAVAAFYVWIFRGTPLLVQLFFWFNLAALYPALTLSVPFGPELYSWDTNSVITVYVAALLGLGLNEAAYMSEIVRAGITSVNDGQSRAAKALGFGRRKIFVLIVFPQAMRLIIPPLGNNFIGMLKGSALVSAIAMPDLLYSAQLIYTRNFLPIPLLLVACFWYLVMTTVLSIIQGYIERYFGKGFQ